MFVLQTGDRIIFIGSGARAYATVNAIHSDTGNWWTVPGKTTVAAYQPKGAASLAASYVNLANPGTYDAAPGVAPTWASGTGWTFNGSTQYLNTGIVPGITYSIIVQFSGLTSDGCIVGTYLSSTQRFSLRYQTNNTIYYRLGNGFEGASHAGVTNLALVGDPENKGYYNGIFDRTLTAAAPGQTRSTWIGGRNGAADFAGVTVQAVAMYSTPLTAPQVATLSAAMAAL